MYCPIRWNKIEGRGFDRLILASAGPDSGSSEGLRINIFFAMVFFLFLSFAGLTVNARSGLPESLSRMLQKPEYRNAAAGISVTDVNSGERLIALDEDKRMIPASTIKLITTAAALEILGGDYRFTTGIGYSGKIDKQVLKGDLVIIGGGDPTLGSEHFPETTQDFLPGWIEKVRQAGIKTITGDLVLDGSWYTGEALPETWIWEDIGNYYGTAPSALTVNDNQFRITFSSPASAGQPTVITSIEPQIKGMVFQNEVTASDNTRDLAYVFGSPLDKVRKITGTIPKNRKVFTIRAAVHHPEELLAQMMIQALAKNGIFIYGKTRFINSAKDMAVQGISLSEKYQLIHIHESPELRDIIKVINHKSNNLFTEHLVMQIAGEKNGMCSREAGLAIIQDFWHFRETGPAFFMEDGCGLSHFNAVSPSVFTGILRYMNKQSHYSADFMRSLPEAGSGTLLSFSTDKFPKGSLKAKSGSMTRVRGYAGYLKTMSGRLVAFSIMFNHFGGSQQELTGELENVLEEIRKSY